MSKDMHKLGIMDNTTSRKITVREVNNAQRTEPGRSPPSDGRREIRGLRERAHMSQAVFARALKLSVGYISQLERGAKRPSGPALTLLDLVRRKGVEAIL